MEKGRGTSPKNKKILRLLALVTICLLINILGAGICRRYGLLLYLDNIGSALAAALGGLIPGIVVGFYTNMINGLSDSSFFYYGVLTVLIAILSSVYSSKGYYGRPGKYPMIILSFALVGGGLGSLLTWVMYGFTYGVGTGGPLAVRIYDLHILNEFWSQFTADILIDLADKTITVLIVALVLRLLPRSLKDSVAFRGWRQKPISLRGLKESEGSVHRSLRIKIVLIAALAMTVTGTALTIISYRHFVDAAVSEQTALAQGVADVIVGAIDPDRVDEYLEQGEKAEGYEETERILKGLMDSSEYIEYCYVYVIREDGCHVVFDPDTEDQAGREPGEIEPFDEAFREYVPALLAGEKVGPKESRDSYGWLLTIFEPVKDAEGNCRCHVGVDVNLSHIGIAGYQFLARVVSLFVGFLIMILAVVIWLAEYNVIRPIKSMALQAGRSDYSTEDSRVRSVRGIEELDIHTGDEIENLYHAMVLSSRDMSRSAEDLVHSYEQMQRQTEVISKMQNGLILVLADIVESRDENTGEHVRKTSAYTGVIMRELRREHLYEDQLTDSFIEDVMRSAPLHDVGKIQVPDAILNKPGRLTEEEFNIMKTHTIAGAEIIESAINMVSEGDSGYLKEARKLAKYHHEKWNGTGYPEGLKGEEIPLSARVMAVADVFDALVSRRSYKESFPFEKAMDIIREGSGSHFDPNIAGAFLNASDEVRRVLETHMSR